AGRPSARGNIDIMSIDSDCDNDHDFDLLCPPLAVVVAVVVVIDILTNTRASAARLLRCRLKFFVLRCACLGHDSSL
ncbi:MAG: hypothetical protein ACOC3Y_01150, partial [Desulfohalobiaceae bacterium]